MMSQVRGRGLDMVLVWHDGYLLQWLGANSYRTSHYPYSEESLDVADRLGLVVVAATPSVGLK
jgi:beta-glucuronidase